MHVSSWVVVGCSQCAHFYFYECLHYVTLLWCPGQQLRHKDVRCIRRHMPLPESIHTKMWFVCVGVVGCLGVGACSNCTSGHRMGMSIQRCSSPQHGAIKLHCQSSRGIQKCFVLSSQVFDATYLSFSNKDMYCKEILYKYSHGLLSLGARHVYILD